MTVKIKPENTTQPKTPKLQKGKLLILIDCAIPKKTGSKEYVYFKEGDIVEFTKTAKESLYKPCCGSEYQYYYILKGSHLKMPVQLAKEL